MLITSFGDIPQIAVAELAGPGEGLERLVLGESSAGHRCAHPHADAAAGEQCELEMFGTELRGRQVEDPAPLLRRFSGAISAGLRRRPAQQWEDAGVGGRLRRFGVVVSRDAGSRRSSRYTLTAEQIGGHRGRNASG